MENITNDSIKQIVCCTQKEEVLGFLHKENTDKNIKAIRKKAIETIPTKDIWEIFEQIIIIFKTENTISDDKINEILKKHNLHRNQNINIKVLVRYILSFYKQEGIIQDTLNEAEKILKDEHNKEIRIATLGARIRDYFEVKDNNIFWVFKRLFLKRKKDGNSGNYYDNIIYTIKAVCKIYQKEYNDTIENLFKDWARGNIYLEDEDEKKKIT